MTRLIGLAALAAGIAFAQTSTAGSAPKGFEVSSIKAVPSMRPAYVDEAGKQHTMYQFAPGGRFVVHNGTLRFLITTAFHVKDFQLVGAPSWADSERYDVEAKAFTSLSPDSMLPLVQALLIERFGLAFHRETRDLPVYHLITAKNGNKPREHVQGNCRMPDEPNIPPDPNNVFANLNCGNVLYLPPAWLLGGMVRISSQGTGGESFAGRQSLSKTFVEILSTPLGRMVIDQTGLRGTYDINLRWSAEGSDADGTPGPSLSTALQEQLGLRLESARGPVEVLVIERVSKPSEN